MRSAAGLILGLGVSMCGTFKDLLAPNPVPLTFEDEDLPLAWVAASNAKILGVIITQGVG
jgi:hypothetical protein